jgi:hypothetical protein
MRPATNVQLGMTTAPSFRTSPINLAFISSPTAELAESIPVSSIRSISKSRGSSNFPQQLELLPCHSTPCLSETRLTAEPRFRWIVLSRTPPSCRNGSTFSYEAVLDTSKADARAITYWCAATYLRHYIGTNYLLTFTISSVMVAA